MKIINIMLLLLILLPLQAFAATEVFFTINPDSSDVIIADYASLENWEAAEKKDLVTADEQYTVICRSNGTADTEQIIFNSVGWDTSETCYVKIWTDPTESYRHNGTYQTGSKYRIENTGNFMISFTSDGPQHVYIIGLQFKSSTANTAIKNRYCANLYIEQCIFDGNSVGLRSVWTQGTSMSTYMSNCVIYGYANEGVQIRTVGTSSTKFILYNCTINNCGDYGINNDYDEDGYNMLVKNCLVQNCGSECFTSGSVWDADSGYNCSDDDTQIGANGINGEVLFIDEANEDLHLNKNDTVVIGKGIILFGDSDYSISTDIDNDSRSGLWDIGADDPTKPIWNVYRVYFRSAD